MTDFTITSAPQAFTKSAPAESLAFPGFSSMLGGERHGWKAEAQLNSTTVQVTRFSDESGWTIDAASQNGCPIWANGQGSRVGITKRLAEEFAAILDAAL